MAGRADQFHAAFHGRVDRLAPTMMAETNVNVGYAQKIAGRFFPAVFMYGQGGQIGCSCWSSVSSRQSDCFVSSKTRNVMEGNPFRSPSTESGHDSKSRGDTKMIRRSATIASRETSDRVCDHETTFMRLSAARMLTPLASRRERRESLPQRGEIALQRCCVDRHLVKNR